VVRVYVSTVIKAPVERVWEIVRDFNGLPGWMPGIESSRIEDGKSPTAVGAVRRMGLARGAGEARERLEELSDDERLVRYSLISGPLPVTGLTATIRLRPITEGNATFGEWSADLDPRPGAERSAAEMVGKVFSAGWRGLIRKLEG
jgi:uncharacterized protein YndB with AHSA1/START domain